MLNEMYLDSFDGEVFESFDDLIFDRDESYESCKRCGGEMIFDTELNTDVCIECSMMQ